MVAPEKIEIIEEDIPALGDDQVLYKVVSGGLCHSEISTYRGIGSTGVTKYPYTTFESRVVFPRGVGHEPVCIVEDVGRNVTKFQPGDWVTGHISRAFASHLVTGTVGLVKIPPETNRKELCLGEPLSCVVNIVRATDLKYGDSVAVIGCGVMGLLTLKALSQVCSGHIIAMDLNEERLKTAARYGATHLINPAREDAEQVVFELTQGRGLDAVVEISGNLRALETALSVIRIPERYSAKGRGRIVVGSVYANQATWTPQMGYNMVLRVPELHSVHPMYSQDLEGDVRRAVEGYINGTFPMDKLISHTFSFENIQQGFELMNSGDKSYCKGVILFD